MEHFRRLGRRDGDECDRPGGDADDGEHVAEVEDREPVHGDEIDHVPGQERSLAKVGIIALVDEATGYQDVRARDELQRLLSAYVLEAFRPWVQMFPDEFFREIYRLYGWDYKPGNSKRPGYVGRFINTYIYEQLPDGVVEELRRVNPVGGSGYRARKHHQHLTADTGNQHLDRQILTVTTLMQVSDDVDGFKQLFERRFPGKTGKKVLRVQVDEHDEIQTLFEFEDFAGNQ